MVTGQKLEPSQGFPQLVFPTSDLDVCPDRDSWPLIPDLRAIGHRIHIFTIENLVDDPILLGLSWAHK